MALLLFHSTEEPVRCSLEINITFKEHSRIQLRMGVHSGPVNQVTDVNDKTNIAGAGINVAQRVMDCGDAGHVLLSGHIAEDLAQYRQWQPYLHDLGECEVKHGLRLHLVNLYKDNLGNPHLPDKLKRRRRWKQTSGVSIRPIITPRWLKYVLTAVLLVSAVALAISFSVSYRRGSPAVASSSSGKAADLGLPIPEKSIAVLPFENLSEDKANAYFAEGIQDEILTRLSKIADLKVISRTSTQHYKSAPENLTEIGKQLGVAHIEEGSVQKSGSVVPSRQPTVALREETRQAAETSLTLQRNLGEAVLAKGHYHYACLKDYDTAVRYFEQARPLLPNSSRIPESLAYLTRRRGEWDRSESYFNEAERLDPRNVTMLNEHATSYISLRRFPEALRKLDQVLNIVPDDVDTLTFKAAIAQAKGDLPRAAALLAPLHPSTDDSYMLETQVYQEMLERRPAQIIPRLKEILTKPDPALGPINGELRFWLGWAQEVAGDHAAAKETWRQARSELESFLKEQPDNYLLIGDLALTNMALGDKAAALALSERAIAVNPIEKDALVGPIPIEILARVTAQMGEPDRAIVALRKLLSIPGAGAFPAGPLTPALLRLDPMFDSLRNDPRFEKLVASPAPNDAKQ